MYLNDPLDKRDVRQEILLQCWKSRNSYQGNSSFATWMYRVALNTVLTFKRRDEKRKFAPLNDRDQLEELPQPSENTDLLHRAVQSLNDIDKTIITLHLEDFRNQEIADIIGLTKNNVTVKLHRIKQSLTAKLNPSTHE